MLTMAEVEVIVHAKVFLLSELSGKTIGRVIESVDNKVTLKGCLGKPMMEVARLLVLTKELQRYGGE